MSEVDYKNIYANCTTVGQVLDLKDVNLKSDVIIELTNKLKGSTDGNEKKDLGMRLVALKKTISDFADSKIVELQSAKEKDSFRTFDPTFFSAKYEQVPAGSLHPITLITEEIYEIFKKMGFDIFDNSQIESQWLNFTSVGTPDYHPARTMQDTFFIDKKDDNGENYVMRTQVTANICTYAKSHQPPFRVIFPGLAFRAENMDATHDINFHQMDMWLVEKHVNISQLVSLLKTVFREFFQDDTLEIRLRPSYFPFTEPSFEIDIFAKWFKGGRWIEVAGAGPIHRNVIKNMGLDDNEYSGLAFGLGLTRMAQLKFELTGITQFYNGNTEFLAGF
jgi:phenylalanyl-tRNA synthetase alpha chain